MREDKIGTATLINGDCMEYLRSLPNNAFDLAVVDPPYGDANFQNPPHQGKAMSRDGGGGSVVTNGRWSRFGQRFDRYKRAPQPQREIREIQPCKLPPPTKISRLRKESGGILHPMRSISKNCSGFPKIRLSGEETISDSLRQDVSLYGASCQYLTNSRWLCVNMRGLHSTPTQRYLSVCRRAQGKTPAYILHKSRSNSIGGCWRNTPKTA